MLLARSIAFTVLFYLNLAARLILSLPVFLLGSERACWGIVKGWGRSNMSLLRTVTGTRSAVTGSEHLPHGPAIVAAKHQSFWEVFALLPAIARPSFVLKKELMHVPLFGLYARRMGMIPVDRRKRGAAIASMVAGARAAIRDGRQIVIFPEGTRTRPGAEPAYRSGIYHLYAELGLPVVPVAVNSGLFWPSRGIRRPPGTIRAEFLPPIEPGLDRATFIARLEAVIEGRTAELVREAFAENPRLPKTPQVERILEEAPPPRSAAPQGAARMA
ncbi:1-acyl-sn-glycerol-3-phosphate acyltransferase [Aurantimonas sp. MSK8Z-1]|uniref:lysophospholipid acyltransferase family protein n=1 Tax=Mangrovibrevibacter kandeliae TaxID=2968473 RepID=UPI0021175007|nr:lysophospholipid acyltransferase family protein [Aurantimonas sp. MSK8Z-1]MCW4116560.1 1-acyl-sn-glycerol-3-phosphate acyltransferase [Aurantimonas sp. MSK8Z-1]